MAIASFERVETKYIIDSNQKEALEKVLLKYMEFDPFCIDGKTYRIRNIYFDTETNDVISNSLMHPVYKEKLRARKYDGQKNVFLEIKKKFNGVVGKRRVTMTEDEMSKFIGEGITPKRDKYVDKQIIKELAYLISQRKLIPATYLSYDREGFFCKDDKELRITFDTNIQSSRTNFDWESKEERKQLLDPGQYILEVKYIGPYPTWLIEALSKLKIYHKTFSKYGTSYKQYLKESHNV